MLSHGLLVLFWINQTSNLLNLQYLPILANIENTRGINSRLFSAPCDKLHKHMANLKEAFLKYNLANFLTFLLNQNFSVPCCYPQKTITVI